MHDLQVAKIINNAAQSASCIHPWLYCIAKQKIIIITHLVSTLVRYKHLVGRQLNQSVRIQCRLDYPILFGMGWH